MQDPSTPAPEPQAGAPATSPFSGVLAAIRRNPRAWIVSAVVAVIVLAGGGAFAVGTANPMKQPAALGASTAHPRSGSPSPSPTVSTPPARPVASPAPAAARLRTCSVAAQAADGRLGTLEAQVVNASTGEVLFDRNGSTPAPTASVMKTVTAGAILASLGPDARISTTVVQGAPGQIVLVGAGDPTLSSRSGLFFQNAPTLVDLATQVKASLGNTPVTSLVLDSSLFGGPSWQPSWDFHEEHDVQGSTSNITALMVDGDKDNASALESPRGTDPVADAGTDFVNALHDQGVDGSIAVSTGTAPAGAKQLAVVQSQPVSTMLNEALLNSDNTVMEMLTRLVAIKEGAGNTFDAENAGVLKALATYGLDTTGLKIVDGSGLSADNRIPPSFMTQYMLKVLGRAGNLGMVYDSLPVAGKTGTLGPGYARFDDSTSSAAVGHVNAKTGWIDGGYTLSGVVHAADGTDLTFAIYALGNVGDSAKNAIDTLTAGFYTCGNNLSNS